MHHPRRWIFVFKYRRNENVPGIRYALVESILFPYFPHKGVILAALIQFLR